jgi:tetratricopeptide (TPR) repeat protein
MIAGRMIITGKKLQSLRAVSVTLKSSSLFLAFLALCVTGGCVHRKFPVVRPEYKQSRQELAVQRAEEYFLNARDYDRRGLNQMALHFYELACELQPQSDILRRLLAEKYILQGQFASALVLIKGDRDIQDLSIDDKRLTVTLYMKMGQFARAIEIIESLSPLSPQEYFSLGYLYESLGILDKSAANYMRFFETDHGHSLATGMKVTQIYARMTRYDDAESLFVRLQNEFVDRKPEILNGLGMLRLTAGDTAKALDFFRTAVLVDSTQYDAMRALAQIAIQNGNFKEAIEYYEKLFYSDDSLNRIYGKALGLLYYYDRQYDKAMALLHELLTDQIDDFELHFYLGLVYAAQKDNDLAAIEFEKTIALQPSYSEAWQHLAYIELRRKNMAKAIKSAKGFTDNHPKSAAAWRTLGYVYNSCMEFKASVKALQKSLSIDSVDAATWFDLGAAFERDSQFARSADAFRRVLRLNPGDHQAANYLGYMWADQGVRLDSAKILLEFALSRDSLNGAYLDSYAWIFYKQGNAEKAYKYILMAIGQTSDDPAIYEHFGDILVSRGDLTGAVEAYHRAIGLGSGNKKGIEDKLRKIEDSGRIPVSREVQ